MKVTDEILDIAAMAHMKYMSAPHIAPSYRGAMKAALEAVFDHIANDGKKVEPVSNTNKLDEGWIKWKDAKKQTLLEVFYEGCETADMKEYKLIRKISKYLEQK